MSTTKPYTADVSLSSDEGINRDLFRSLSSLDGVERVSGRMSSMVSAAFNASRLTDKYKESIGNVQTTEGNLLAVPEKSWLISYDDTQLKWMEDYLSKGTCDEGDLNKKNGIIAVREIYRNNELIKTTDFQLNDKVYVQTNTGTKEFTVMGIIDTAPYSTDELILTTFITTEKLFKDASNDTQYKTVDIQLMRKNQEQTVNKIKEMISSKITLHDKRQLNMEADNAFMTVAIFIYGYVGVIVLISTLNIINTMNTSIASKTKYLGTMRAIGMSGKQLNRMVLSQSITYSLAGGIAGSILGVLLQKKLLESLAGDWRFPLLQIILIFAVCVLTSVFSVISPLRRIKSKGISETITAL
jgi:putative ABC transport system permease protein